MLRFNRNTSQVFDSLVLDTFAALRECDLIQIALVAPSDVLGHVLCRSSWEFVTFLKIDDFFTRKLFLFNTAICVKSKIVTNSQDDPRKKQQQSTHNPRIMANVGLLFAAPAR